MTAIAESTTALSFAANDNGPTDTRIDRWRCAIDGFKRLNLIPFALYATECKLRGETFDEFAARIIALDDAERRGQARYEALCAAEGIEP
jgi:hypothetical protein